MPQIGSRKPRLGNLLKMETAVEHGYCRETGTVEFGSETELSVGSVVAKVAGNYVPRNPTGNDGSEVAAGVVMENKTIPANTETEITVLVRGPSIVAREALVFDVAHNDAQKAAAEAELQAAGILARTQV